MALKVADVKQVLRERVLVADGAMGTVLSERSLPLPYERANLDAPALVEEVHRLYVDAGAQVIETNTFGANPVKLAGFSIERDMAEINRHGVRAARAAAGGRAWVAGAIGPCGRALAPLGVVSPEVAEDAFRRQAEVLLEEGVDLLILETFTDMEELRVAYRVMRGLADVPIIAQKVFIEDGDTLSRGLPARVAAEVGNWDGIVAVGANCAIGPQRMLEVVRAMAEAGDCAVSTMPTPGLPQRTGNLIRYAVTPEYFGRAGRLLAEAGASIIGGCCGTSPEHVAALARSLKDARPVSRSRAVATAKPSEAETQTEQPVQDYSTLHAKIGKKFITAVELDLPRGADISKVLEGARALKAVGVDVVDISDGARARLRMNVLSAAHLVQHDAGMEVMMHFACRDRNVLAVQADLLGAHALGIRNILAVTGDPAMIGDYPAATSVYDIDSIGLIRIVKRFNEGIDLAGNSIGRKAAFTVAGAFDPLAPDMARERDRLARKCDEGADLLFTQPIFLESALAEVAAASERHGVPILFGLLPLRSSRHCEFMHNEVPGISIPDDIRARMAELSDEDARRFGMDVAREFLAGARTAAQGVYVMPPFGNYRVAEEVLRDVIEP